MIKLIRYFTPFIVLALLFCLPGSALAAPPEDNPGKGPPELEQIILVHYLDDSNPVKPPKPENPHKPPVGDEDPTLYFELMKLKLPDDVTAYIDNTLAEDVKIAISESFSTWEVVTGPVLFDEILVTDADIFGLRNNGYNTVSFGDLSDSNVIGLASLWYIPGKPPRTTQEWDIVFNTDFKWGTNSSPLVMDVQNIATHEVGHVVGLADLYDLEYQDQTMYGISAYGELKKRDLLAGDILGAQSLYGAPS